MSKKAYNLSKPLKKLLEEKNLKPIQVAKDLNINRAVMSEYINGKKRVGIDRMKTFAKYFNVPTDYLINYEEYFFNKMKAELISDLSTIAFSKENFFKDKEVNIESFSRLAAQLELGDDSSYEQILKLSEEMLKDGELNKKFVQAYYRSILSSTFNDLEDTMDNIYAYLNITHPDLNEDDVIGIIEKSINYTKEIGTIIVLNNESDNQSNDK